MRQRIISLIGNRSVLFLVAFVISLFLGDGKQTAIDCFWPFITIITIPLWEGKKSATAGLGTVLWILFLLSAGISSVLSWSPAYSIPSFMRLLVAFVWFRRISCIQNTELTTLIRGLALGMIVLVPLMVSALLFPQFALRLPPLNLFFAPAGHLPVVYIAVPLLPILYIVALRRQSTMLWVGFGATILAILGSFSRGGLLLLTIFLLGMTILQGKHLGFVKAFGILSGALVLLTFVLLSSTRPLPAPTMFKQYLTKEKITSDSRRSYREQAEDAFHRSPFFGTGPGTFILVSKQFAKAPELISTSAHNIFLQMLAEYGMTGTLLFASLMAYAAFCTMVLFKHRQPFAIIRASFFVSLLLTALLGAVEQNMDRYAVFLLFSVALGVLATGEQRGKHLSGRLVHLTALTLIALYLTSWVASDVTLAARADQLSFYLAPYRYQRSVAFLATKPQPLSPGNQRLFSILYPRDPEIDAVFASYQTGEGDRIAWYKKAIAEDPTNTSWGLGYLGSLLRVRNVPLLCQELRRFAQSPYLDCLRSTFATLVTDGTFASSLAWLTPNDGKAKFFYKLGLDFLGIGDEQSAIILWAKARDIAPNWGYYHVELASLIAQHNQTANAAVPTLLSCLANGYARTQCEGYLHDLAALPPPGSLADAIMAIPHISDIP